MLHRLAISIPIFIASSLIGPLIRWITWSVLSIGSEPSKSYGDFFYCLMFLLWPTQPLAVIEVNTGRLVAAVVAVSANMFVFAFVGLLAVVAMKYRYGLFITYLVVAFLIIHQSLWVAGFSYDFLHVPALVTALIVYTVPFWLSAVLMKRGNDLSAKTL